GPVNRFFLQHRTGAVTVAMKVVTWLGSEPVLVGIAVVVGLGWWLRRRTWRPLVLAVGAWLGAAVLADVLKALIDRARPPARADRGRRVPGAGRSSRSGERGGHAIARTQRAHDPPVAAGRVLAHTVRAQPAEAFLADHTEQAEPGLVRAPLVVVEQAPVHVRR